MAACNTGLAKVAVQCSADTFVVNQSLALRIKFVVKIANFAKPENVKQPYGSPNSSTITFTCAGVSNRRPGL